jgi:hypothetical protein
VLLVDEDDDFPDVRSYYTAPLAAIKATVTPWPVSVYNEPNAAQIGSNEALIWFTGDNWDTSPGPDTDTESEIISWLETTGGCLLITSQDYAFYGVDPSSSSLMLNYLEVDSVVDLWSNSLPAQAEAAGVGVFSGFKTNTFDLPDDFGGNFTDLVMPSSKAKVSFYGDQGPAGIYYEGPGYKTTYWGFPFEMIADLSVRTELLRHFLHWCRFYDSYLPAVNR